MPKRYNVCVVGVGSVGCEMLRILRERNFPIAELKVFARHSRKISFDNRDYYVNEISSHSFKGIDIALFAGTEGEKGAARTFAPEAVKRGAIVIDNGADFRLDPQVPLVIPEVNPEDITMHKGLIANPNCSTIQMVVTLAPIHRVAKIKRIIVSTYQAASGAGRRAVEQLKEETREAIQGLAVDSLQFRGNEQRTTNNEQRKILPQRIAFNFFPHIGSFEEAGFTTEEWKMVKETHKIMHDNSIKITATCVRVATFIGHGEAIYIETEKKITAHKAREILSQSPGLKVIDEPKKGFYPLPIEAEGKDEVFVGRIREDPFTKKGLWLWVVSDNLRKGAALNAVQIAELAIKAKS